MITLKQIYVLLTLSSTPAGTTIGRKLSECGQIGVTIIHGTDGCTIDPPAEPE